MLERNRLISDPESVRKNLKMRRAGEEMFTDLERLIECINTRRAVQKETDQLRANRKSLSKKIGQLMKSGQRDEAEQTKQQVRDQAEKLQQLDHRRKELESEEYDLLLSLPNLLDPTVPEGDSDEHNEVVRSWGEPTHPDFPVLEHHNLLHKIQLLDSERAAKVAGTRFSILRGPIAKLERSLINFFLDEAENNGYLEVMVPYIVNSSSMIGTSQLPKFEKDLFKLTTQVAGEDAYLIPTAEVPVTNIHRGEILNEEALPLHYTAFTPCFRSEAGSYGKDTHGLIRQHQFHKVELVKICTPENSPSEHEALTNHAAQLLEKLGLPYRIMRLCSGDISFGARLCYDLEVWLPGQKQYREISSCSNFGDFQARRMMLRYRPKAGGKPQFCHTINGSGLAIGRSLVAIVENYQQPDGSILIPDCLQDYMKQKKIEIS